NAALPIRPAVVPAQAGTHNHGLWNMGPRRMSAIADMRTQRADLGYTPRSDARGRHLGEMPPWAHGRPLLVVAHAKSLLRLLVGIDHLARSIFGRCQHDLGRYVLELSDIVTLD